MARQLSIPLHFVSITHTKSLHALMVSGKNFENTHVIVGLSDHSNEIKKKKKKCLYSVYVRACTLKM